MFNTDINLFFCQYNVCIFWLFAGFALIYVFSSWILKGRMTSLFRGFHIITYSILSCFFIGQRKETTFKTALDYTHAHFSNICTMRPRCLMQQLKSAPVYMVRAELWSWVWILCSSEFCSCQWGCWCCCCCRGKQSWRWPGPERAADLCTQSPWDTNRNSWGPLTVRMPMLHMLYI